MTEKEIVQALRCCKFGEPCNHCPVVSNENCVNVMHKRAADLIERLTAENAELRKELEWKDMVIALAQRKQAEAEAEREALLGELWKSGCTYCKYGTVCEDNPWPLIQKDCDHCGKRESCVCQTCTGDGSETDKWQWRGLPEVPEEGDKADA